MQRALVSLAAAALGLGALGAQPAQAQGFSVTIGTPGYDGPPVPVYRPYPVYRPVYGRPAYRPSYAYRAYAPAYDGPRCTTELVRSWDGWGWVTRRREICD